MCKLLLVAGFDQSKKDKNWNFIREMGDSMSVNNSHGLGYAAINNEQELYWEKWLYNEDAFHVRYLSKHARKITSIILQKYKNIISQHGANSNYRSFGSINSSLAAIILHTRFATCEKTLNNVHPFIDVASGTALVHNGKITNTTSRDNTRSTCDSEKILNEYIFYNVLLNPINMNKVCEELCGDMACGIFGKNMNGYYLDIWKSHKDNLYGIYIIDLKITVFTTDLDDIRRVCKKLKYQTLCPFKIKENVLLRLNVLSGQVISITPFTGIKHYTEYNNEKYIGYYSINK